MNTMRPLSLDPGLVDTARARGTAERQMAVSAEQLFATLEDGPSWSKWANVIRDVDWTSPKPHGVGTTRTVTLVGGVTVDERFWRWEQDRGFAFSVTAANADWVSGLGERYEILPIDGQRCTLRWTLALSFLGSLARLEPFVGWTLPGVQRILLKRLEGVARNFGRA